MSIHSSWESRNMETHLWKLQSGNLKSLTDCWNTALKCYPIVIILSCDCLTYKGSFSSSLGLLLWQINKMAVAWLRLTPALRRPYIHAIFFSTACWTACKHAFRFLRVLPEAMSTRHSWLWQTLDDVYTRRCFSESEGTRFGAPGQKALPSVNEFTLLWIFA